MDQYERFLETTNVEEKELVARFMDKKLSHEYTDAAYKFGDFVFEALNHMATVIVFIDFWWSRLYPPSPELHGIHLSLVNGNAHHE